MPIGELTIKNDDLGAIIGRVLEGENRKPDYEKKTEQEAVEDMIGTYAMDIFTAVWQWAKIWNLHMKHFPICLLASHRVISAAAKTDRKSLP